MRLFVYTRDGQLARCLVTAARQLGVAAERVASFSELETLAADRSDACAIADLPDDDATRALAALLERRPSIPVLALRSDATEATVVDALKHGATDVLVKPFGIEPLEAAIRRLFARLGGLGSWVGVSSASAAIVERAQRLAGSEATILIRGALGVGKTHLARLIHEASPRRSEPLVEVATGDRTGRSLRELLHGGVGIDGDRAVGLFEMARGGTLLIENFEEFACDESSPDEDLEELLLDFLERRTVRPSGQDRAASVDLRIIATTRRTTPSSADQPFSQLEARLDVLSLEVPPLAERRADIDVLAQHFGLLFSSGARTSRRLSDEMLERLRERDLSGNVSELQSLVQRAALLSDDEWVDPSTLAGEVAPGPARPAEGLEALNLREMERAAVVRSLELAGGDRRTAARALGVTTRTLRNKIRAYGLR